MRPLCAVAHQLVGVLLLGVGETSGESDGGDGDQCQQLLHGRPLSG